MASRCRPVSQPKRNVAPATDTKSAVARKVSTTSGALSGTKAIGSSFSGQYRRGRESPEAALAPVEVSQRRLELGHGEIRPERGGGEKGGPRGGRGGCRRAPARTRRAWGAAAGRAGRRPRESLLARSSQWPGAGGGWRRGRGRPRRVRRPGAAPARGGRARPG